MNGMNYYNPNFYQNYYPLTGQYPASPQQQPLNGKIVDNAEVVKVTEVPIGGYGVFPKADLSEIYIKNWNSNGTTSILTFRPYVPPEPEPDTSAQTTQQILDRLSTLESKLDDILASASANTAPKKGVKLDEY